MFLTEAITALWDMITKQKPHLWVTFAKQKPQVWVMILTEATLPFGIRLRNKSPILGYDCKQKPQSWVIDFN